MKSQIAYGLDLAGYSTGKSGFAKASVDASGATEVTVYSNHAFSRSVGGHKEVSIASRDEITLLKFCLASGRLLIDMPLDLQALTEPWKAQYVWQLTKRPVDYAFSALPPMADKIGSPVARVRNWLHLLGTDDASLLGYGQNLFETYPAGSLELLKLPHTKYKGQRVTFLDGKWVGDTLAVVANGLGLVAENDVSLNDDEVDAVICALTGILPGVLEGSELQQVIATRLSKRLPNSTNIENLLPPNGYRLLSSCGAESIRIRVLKDCPEYS